MGRPSTSTDGRLSTTTVSTVPVVAVVGSLSTLGPTPFAWTTLRTAVLPTSRLSGVVLALVAVCAGLQAKRSEGVFMVAVQATHFSTGRTTTRSGVFVASSVASPARESLSARGTFTPGTLGGSSAGLRTTGSPCASLQCSSPRATACTSSTQPPTTAPTSGSTAAGLSATEGCMGPGGGAEPSTFAEAGTVSVLTSSRTLGPLTSRSNGPGPVSASASCRCTATAAT
mmetsp:Transcript_13919/g.32365  ORF Transcript_13919/g.32365 Transcript_13919/m.32365 type:complete len:228 (+) Transcript_13919:347-1030(+)